MSLGNAVGVYLLLSPDWMGILAPSEAPLPQLLPFSCFSKPFPCTLSKT